MLTAGLQIALQQQLFAAARARSQSLDAAAAATVAAAYNQATGQGAPVALQPSVNSKPVKQEVKQEEQH